MILRFYYAKPTAGYKKLFSTIMQIGENVDFGHVAVGLETFAGNTVYEAVMPKTRKLSFAEWTTHYEVVREVQWTVPNHLQALVREYLEGIVGIPYSLLQILVIGLTCIFKPLDFVFKAAIINQAKAQICTEVLSRFAEKFMGYKMRKTHDEFGLEDAQVMGDLLELNPKWLEVG